MQTAHNLEDHTPPQSHREEHLCRLGTVVRQKLSLQIVLCAHVTNSHSTL